ncbi:MAG: envelope stress response membrane protein PspC [Rhodospirillales bacterium]|jgi:phage shock protein C|nr:envelope stress response membrane protein PspC [Rhodospirillaceae bacterium]MDP6426481.1 envelope stress response membrane protein PspC [Rhodospirillales bacterium]MDP6643014.1 envelope stress response membrane protein PspC [Rhodospirillales bacterium]MDP6842158.1 envelope stress response membrane protein PspC [Rhodospirillales bacterium]|tara:strand:- start:1167 stop:1577 length:411 start_codon:yes stop_codon:yes gene_type:complete
MSHHKSRHHKSGHRQSPNHLYRDPENGMIMGVCAGIADYFGVSAGGVRIVMVIALFFFTVPIFVGYFIAGFLLKPKPPGLYADADEEDFWRRTRVDPHRTVTDIQQKYRAVERRMRAAEAYVTSSEFKLKRDFRDI